MHCELTIYWNEEDNVFLVEIPELSGCMADIASYEEAVAKAQQVISEWVKTARSHHNRLIPRRKLQLAYALNNIPGQFSLSTS